MALFAQLRRSFNLGLAQLRRAWAPDGVIVIPAIVASNARVINLRTSQVYYSKGTTANEDRPASLTKLMAVLVLLDYKPDMAALSQTVTIVSSDLVGGSGDNLLAGDALTLHALMMDALLPSSNSAATAIARTIGQELLDIESGGAGDPVARFVTAMNAKASSIGCAETTFFNASGLGGDNTSSPADINVIASLLWQSEIARAAWQYQTYGMPVTRSGSPTTVTITTSNKMFADAGIVGGKTGTLTTGGATYNLTVLWRAPNLDVVALTIFGSSSDAQRYADMRALIAALPGDYPDLAVVPPHLSASSGLAAGGSATLAASLALSAVGLVVSGGDAPVRAAVPLSAIGYAIAGGNAVLDGSSAGDLQAIGGAQAGGSANIVANVRISAEGLMQAAGAAGLTVAVLQAAAGGAQAGGDVVLSLEVQLAASGGMQAGGVAALDAGEPGSISAIGGAQAGGSGAITATVPLTAAGILQAFAAGYLVAQVDLSAVGGAAPGGAAVLSDAAALVLIESRRWVVEAAGRRWVVTA
jgi:D-alanyl-D-alanine carboxypeptidase